MEEKDIQCTFRYVHNSVQTNKFMFKLLVKSRKNHTKCNKTHTLFTECYRNNCFYCC